MGGAHETAGASSTYEPFMWRLLTFTGWNWKCHVIIVIKTDLPGFGVPIHSGLCKQYVKSLGLTTSGFDFLCRTHPCALGQQTPPEPVMIITWHFQFHPVKRNKHNIKTKYRTWKINTKHFQTQTRPVLHNLSRMRPMIYEDLMMFYQ